MESKKNDDDQDPFPDLDLSELMGFLELLDTKGGSEDLYRLSSELQMELGEVLSVVTGAELLGLLSVEEGDVKLEPLGFALTEAGIPERKKLMRESLQKLPMVKSILNWLILQDDQSASREEVIQFISAMNLQDASEELFDRLIQWGRFTELFGYNDDDEVFYLDQA